MFVFDPADQVAGIRKGRDPTAIDQHRVPADVIDVEMRADHRVDRLARMAGGGEIREKPRLELVPGRYPPVLLVVAETGIDDYAAAPRLATLGLDDKSMDAHLEPPALVGEVGLQPADRQHRLIARLRQDEPAAAGDLELDDLADRDLADPPFHDRAPGYCTCSSSTSKIKVALGGIAPGAPRAPYPSSGGIVRVRAPPTFIPATPSSQPAITCLAPRVNWKGWPRSTELSNFLPLAPLSESQPV